MLATFLLILGQIASLVIAITVARKFPQPAKALFAGILAGLATSLAIGFAVGFLGNVVLMSQIDFWLANKLMSWWALVTGNPIGG